MLKQITAIIIAFGVGASAMFIFLSPKIQRLAGEQIKIEAFSECVDSKTMGVEGYRELYMIDVISCYTTTIE